MTDEILSDLQYLATNMPGFQKATLTISSMENETLKNAYRFPEATGYRTKDFLWDIMINIDGKEFYSFNNRDIYEAYIDLRKDILGEWPYPFTKIKAERRYCLPWDHPLSPKNIGRCSLFYKIKYYVKQFIKG